MTTENETISFRSLATPVIAEAGGVYAAIAFCSLAQALRLAVVQGDMVVDVTESSDVTLETVRPGRSGTAT